MALKTKLVVDKVENIVRKMVKMLSHNYFKRHLTASPRYIIQAGPN